MQHPLNPDIDHVALTMIHGPLRHRAEAAVTPSLPNGTVDLDDPTTWTGTLDRSPCGTGTCARMAARHARGEQAIGQDFVHEGLLGTTFTDASASPNRLLSGRFALPQRPRLDHRLNTYVLAEDDPFPRGYTVADLWGPEPAGQ